MTKYEQETIINYNESEKTANNYTHSGALIRRLEKLCQDRPNECKLGYNQNEPRGRSYDIPKKWLKVSPTRIMSEAQRKASAESLRKAHLSRVTPPRGVETQPESVQGI